MSTAACCARYYDNSIPSDQFYDGVSMLEYWESPGIDFRAVCGAGEGRVTFVHFWSLFIFTFLFTLKIPYRQL